MICQQCYNAPKAAHSVSRCLGCLEASRVKQKARRAARRAKGLCQDCNWQAVPFQRFCPYHRKMSRRREGTLGSPDQPRPKLIKHRPVTNKYQRWVEKNVSQGLCDRCVKPAAPYRSCETCRKKKNKNRLARQWSNDLAAVSLLACAVTVKSPALPAGQSIAPNTACGSGADVTGS